MSLNILNDNHQQLLHKRSISSGIQGKHLLRFALVFCLMTHGLLVYTTLPKTYDAFVHLFFADHYSRFWFEPWEYRWYTGFPIYGYPPLVHQIIALIGKIFPLKVSIAIYAIIIMEIVVIGTYRFTLLFYDSITAGISSILVVVLSSVIQTLHVFGQLPTLTGIACLLNALPYVYKYIYYRKYQFLIMALLFISIVICSHHVTLIFGSILFIAPTIYMVLYDKCFTHAIGTISIIGRIKKYFITIINNIKYLIIFFIILIILVFVLIIPYWYNSSNFPIDQIPIPHGSRDNFFKNPNSGLIFFIIPLIIFLSFIPAIIYQIYKYPRFLVWGLSLLLCFILGSGGTTQIPRLLLGDKAFDILTFDRFAFWCSFLSIPFISHFIKELYIDSIHQFFVIRHGIHFYRSIIISITAIYFIFILLIFHLGYIRPIQPKEIDIQPIVNFLNRDEHYDWRYLTLGFGDQMAWLSMNTLAATVDGNYHSSRRLPELTSRPVERLENAKYLGDDGIAALNDFMIKADKYNLRYIFSNDQFYDPLLFYNGWNRVLRLENGIMVWEKNNIPKVSITHQKQFPQYFIFLWGFIPVTVVFISILFLAYYYSTFPISFFPYNTFNSIYTYPAVIIYSSSFIPLIIYVIFTVSLVIKGSLSSEMTTPVHTILNYYQHLDFQNFYKAFKFYHQTPSYTLDQFLLEKSVNDGGLIPSYAKLDTIKVDNIYSTSRYGLFSAFATWNTSVGKRYTLDTLEVQLNGRKWEITPPKYTHDVNAQQIDSYEYIIFKKSGKRVVSTFPTVYDDRVKKAFVQYRQVNLIYNNGFYITGEILNADNFPINISIKSIIELNNGDKYECYGNKGAIYNLAPKGKTFFKIELDTSTNHLLLDDIQCVSVITQSDLSDRGYIHGGPIEVNLHKISYPDYLLNISISNQSVSDMSIPAVLVAHLSDTGLIIDTELLLFDHSIRSGLSRNFLVSLKNQSLNAKIIRSIPIRLYVNDQERSFNSLQPIDTLSSSKMFSFLPHCFFSKEIFLQ